MSMPFAGTLNHSPHIRSMIEPLDSDFVHSEDEALAL
jgi:hypothetical protein